MAYTYQWSLVAFSVFLAILASYTTLRLAYRLAWASRQALPYWIAGGAFSMGIGIWAMHFVGMLALHLPVPLAYDASITAVSVLPAILASAIALFVLSRSGSSAITRLFASVLMGLGIVTMHYSGMAAMQMSPPIVYDKEWLALSVLIAIGASWGALFLVFQQRSDAGMSFARRLASAVVMGVAIAGMHYTGMASAQFAPDAVCTVAANGLEGGAIGLFVGFVAVLVLSAALALTFFDEVVGENDFYKALLEAQSDAGEGVLLIENDKVIYANSAMERLSGYSGGELKALPGWAQLLGEAELLRLKSGLVAPGGLAQTSGRREIELKTRDGVLRPCEAVVTSFRHAEAMRHLLVCIDISERKAAEEALRARDTQTRELALVASLTDNAVIITDAQGLITWVNDGFEKISGYTADEARGQKPGTLLQGADTDPAMRQRIREHLDRGESFAAEIVNYHKLGRKYWVTIDVQPVLADNGDIVKFIAIERDITERKLADDILRKSEERLKEAERLAHVGSFENDLSLNEPLFSEEALRIHELTSETGRVPWSQLAAVIHPDDLDALRQSRARALEESGRYSLEHRLLFPDGRLKYVHTQAAIYRDGDGKPTRIIGSVQDITERKLADQALRAREEQALELALVASSTDNGVIIMDAKAKITWINEGFTRMCGYNLSEVLNRRPGDFLNGAETDPATLAFISERLSKGERFETEIVHYHKSGRKYWAVVDVQAVRDESGKTIKYISIERDITKRKEADAALRLSEARLNEAQELAHIGSWEHDLASDEYIFSDEALRIHELNAPAGRLPRALVAAAMHPEDLSILRQHRSAALAGLTGYSVQLRLVFAHNRIKHVHIRAAVHGDARGKPVRVMGTVQDITEQKLAEQALLTLNETLEERVLDRTHELDQQRTFIETILDTAETLIFVLDSRGYFVRFNGACERLTGFGFEELRDRPIWDTVVPPERKAEVRLKHENQTSVDKIIRNLEVEWLTRSGQRHLIAFSNAVLTDDAGHLKYMIGTGIDITDRKRAEKSLIEANQNLSKSLATLRETQTQLVQAEKMASLGGLVAGISHEINTPIGIGVTSATALQEELVALRREFEGGAMKRSTLERFLAYGMTGCEILVSNLMRAAELVRSFKQVAVDQTSDEWRELNLHVYVDEVILSLKPKLKGRQIEVVNAGPTDLLIYTHPGAIYQILSNLLLNALIHAYETDQSGVIRITAEQLGDEIQLDFSDDGKGIPEAIQGRIFDPFFTTRRGAGGSGLGLHIVFNLVASTLNGVIYLVKNVAHGTTFRIRFPMYPEKQAS